MFLSITPPRRPFGHDARLMGFVVSLAHGAFAMAGGWCRRQITLYAHARRRLCSFSLVSCGGGCRRGERRVRARASIVGSHKSNRSGAGAAHHRSCIHGDRDSRLYLYGPILESAPLPDWLQGDVNLGFRNFPSYLAGLFLIALGVVPIVVPGTRWSAPISVPRSAPLSTTGAWRNRSASIRRPPVHADLRAGSLALAALGGGLGASICSASRRALPLVYLVLFLIVVAVGGLGSLKGTSVGGACARRCSIPAEISVLRCCGGFFVYAVTVAVLLVRTGGVLRPRVSHHPGGPLRGARARGGASAQAPSHSPRGSPAVARRASPSISFSRSCIDLRQPGAGDGHVRALARPRSSAMPASSRSVMPPFSASAPIRLALLAARWAGASRSAGCSRPRLRPALVGLHHRLVPACAIAASRC